VFMIMRRWNFYIIKEQLAITCMLDESLKYSCSQSKLYIRLGFRIELLMLWVWEQPYWLSYRVRLWPLRRVVWTWWRFQWGVEEVSWFVCWWFSHSLWIFCEWKSTLYSSVFITIKRYFGFTWRKFD
jgi:hypothetical protein